MTTPHQSGPALPFASFLILAALGSFLWNTGPLESSRPTSKDEGAYNRAKEFQVPTRLWQDPLKTVYKEVTSDQAQTSGLDPLLEKINAATKDENSQLTILGVMVSKGSYAEVEERRRRRRYAVLAGLAEADFVPASAEYVQYLNLNLASEYCPHKTINKTGVDTQDTAAKKYCQEVIPYEWYELDEFSEKVRDRKEKVLVLWLSDSLFSQQPFERFGALVKTLLDEEGGLEHEQKKQQQDVAQNKKHKSEKNEIDKAHITFYTLGPARSEALATMVKQANREVDAKVDGGYTALQNLGIKGFHILAPTATVANRELLKGIDNKLDKSIIQPEEKREELNGTISNQLNHLDDSIKYTTRLIPSIGCGSDFTTCVTFLRTISHDGKVIGNLKTELRKRGIELDKHNIALISEWDTSFGRALPRNFLFGNYNQPAVEANVHEFSYLRGIDGRTVGTEDIGRETASKTAKNNGKETSKNALVSAETPTDIRRPVGTGQYDYLRRLATRIKALDKKLKYDPHGNKNSTKGIRAIGILGSDVYDKLLILRTLRKSFPGILFFTTDLDAQLLHPDEFVWARNLIVASSFDLQLNEDLQGRIPPFRDSYQTSVFFSTLLAVKAKINTDIKVGSIGSNQGTIEQGEKPTGQKDPVLYRQALIDHWVAPQIFEVGRHGAVPLNPIKASENHQNHHGGDICDRLNIPLGGNAELCEGNQVHPEKAESLFWQLGLAVFFVAFIVIFALHQVRPQSGIQVLWLSVSLLLISGLVIGAYYLSACEEPLSFSDGISAWPTIFFRFITMLLAIYFLITALINIRNNRLRLTRDYYLNRDMKAEPSPRDVTVNVALKNMFHALAKIRDVDHRSLVALLFVIGAVILMGFIRKTMSLTQIQWALVYWLLFFTGWYFYIFFYAKVRSINKWVKEIEKKKGVEVTSLWNDYCKIGETKHRVYRSLTIAFLYMSFASIIFFLLQQDTNVWRGWLSFFIGMILTTIPVVIMIFLIFFVTDATRLCICWIKAMGQKKLSWDPAILKAYSRKLNVNEEYLEEWLKIQLIADRTHEIGQLIYYPFIIIILMLISRSTYFDNWGFPQALAIVVTINLVILSSVAMLLRKQAENVRGDTIGTLEHELVKIAGCRSPLSDANLSDDELKQQKCHIEQINKLLEEIRNIKSGAFRSVLDQPLVRAGLILLGGLGLGLSEYSFLLW